MTKVGFLLAFILLNHLSGFSQIADSSSLEYKGGHNKFVHLLVYEVSIADCFSDRNFYKVHHMYYEIQFRIDKNGNLGDQIMINSIHDTLLGPSIILAMKKSQGNWINHSGKDILAILPVNFYNDSGDSTFTDSTRNMLPVWHASYNRWENSNILYLKTIDIQSGPPVNKVSLRN